MSNMKKINLYVLWLITEDRKIGHKHLQGIYGTWEALIDYLKEDGNNLLNWEIEPRHAFIPEELVEQGGYRG